MKPGLIRMPALTVPEGDGVTVKRLMPIHGMRNFDPFVLWDHFDIGPGNGFPDHPHRGFEAITYLFEGGMQHADNLGNRSVVRGGGAQRFTAGRGLVHSEMPDRDGANGIQLWINLPKQLKTLDPAYQQVDAAEFPVTSIEGGTMRTIVGEGSPLLLRTGVEYLDIELEKGACFERTVPEGFQGLIYAVSGNLQVQEEHLPAGSAAFVEQRGGLRIEAMEASRLMWCFGAPHGEPIHQHGPFVD
jgi:hypothetical protein